MTAGWLGAIKRGLARLTAWLADRLLLNVSDEVLNHEPLPESERPECPYCGQRLGVAPGYDALAWKCRVHGTFPTAEFEPNILRAMQADVSGDQK